MKKNYLKPEAEILDIEIDVIMNSVSQEEGEMEGDFGTNKYRGDWGNIWGEEE